MPAVLVLVFLNNCESLENTVVSLFNPVSLTTYEHVSKHRSLWHLTGYSLFCDYLPINLPFKAVSNHRRSSPLVLCKKVWGNQCTRLLNLGCMLNFLHVMSTVPLLFRLGRYPERLCLPLSHTFEFPFCGHEPESKGKLGGEGEEAGDSRRWYVLRLLPTGSWIMAKKDCNVPTFKRSLHKPAPLYQYLLTFLKQYQICRIHLFPLYGDEPHVKIDWSVIFPEVFSKNWNVICHLPFLQNGVHSKP